MGGLLEAFLEEGVLAQTSKRSVYFAIRRDGSSGAGQPPGADGSPESPYDGSTAAKLDPILNPNSALGISTPNTRFIFGPGIFRTRGFGPTLPIWFPLDGQEFIGAGIFATTLRLELPSSGNDAYHHIIGNDITRSARGVRIADMTLDANVDGQPATAGYAYPRVACGAIHFHGDHVRAQRVRVINAGTRAPGRDEYWIVFQRPEQ